MPNRIAATAAVTLAATLATGTVALATTLTEPSGPVGTDAAVSLQTPEPAGHDTPPATSTASLPAFDPQAVALLAFAARVNATTATTAPGAALAFGLPSGPAASAPTPTGSPSSPAPAHSPTGGKAPQPVTTTTPPTPPPTTATTSPPFNCSGNDDGLSEAVKHAREQYCWGDD